MEQYNIYKDRIENRGELPQYPIPSLRETLQRFTEWVEPLVSDFEMKQADEAVKVFLESQDSKKLETFIADMGKKKDDSWIFDYWVKSHLKIRDPLSPHTNVPIIYENDKLLRFEVVERMAMVIHGIANVYKAFKEKQPSVYTLQNKTYSTDQFHGLLASMNNIQKGIDSYTINEKCSDHIVFTCMNRFFSVKVIEDGHVVDIGKILMQLKEIIRRATAAKYPNVNLVTIGVNRDKAADLLEELMEVEQNRTAYKIIEEAIFIMNYDDIVSKSVYEQLNNASYHKEYVNRWHGKGLQFSCSKNGVLSMIADHSFVDGGTEIYLVDQLKQEIEAQKFIVDDCKLWDENSNSIKEIQFYITDKQGEKLHELKTEYDECMKEFETRYVEFEGLNRYSLKEKNILSGDGFIHVAFQLAQYKTFRRVYNTYISVDARRYFRGRTECNRPVSNSSIDFVKSFDEQDRSREQLVGMLHDALDEHHKRVKTCQAGNGVNRYMYVLEAVYEEFGDALGIKKRPKLFDTKAFSVMGSNHLSTTSFGHTDTKYLYFPPVIPEGFGIFYMVDTTSFMIITAYEEKVDLMENFIQNLHISINEMLELINFKEENGCQK